MTNINRLTDTRAVLAAVAECDRIGRETFLERNGFKPLRHYALVVDGRQYDSKAIAGVAYGIQFPDEGVPHDFNGGVTPGSAARCLADLGFEVVDIRTGAPI